MRDFGTSIIFISVFSFFYNHLTIRVVCLFRFTAKSCTLDHWDICVLFLFRPHGDKNLKFFVIHWNLKTNFHTFVGQNDTKKNNNKALETFLRNSKSDKTRSHTTKCLQKKRGWEIFFGHNFFLSTLLDNLCHADHVAHCRINRQGQTDTGKKKGRSCFGSSYTDNHTSTYRLNGGFFLKPTTSIV